VAELSSTGRVRRSVAPGAVRHDDLQRSKYRRGIITPAAPRPAAAPTPHGDLSAAGAQEIVELAGQVWPGRADMRKRRRRAVRALLGHLAGLPGGTWQQRWDASEFADGTTACRSVAADPAAEANTGLKLLLCLRVLRPDLPAMAKVGTLGYADVFRAAQADPQLDRLFAHIDDLPVTRTYRAAAKLDIAYALTVYGIAAGQLTPAGLLHFAWQCRQHRVGPYRQGRWANFSGQLAWQALRAIGQFPPETPPTLLAAGQRGQLSVTELVDRYPIANQQVRQLLIDYLTRRATVMTYGSLTGLARWLAGVFWTKIEQIAPGQRDLHLPGHVYDQWRAAIRLRDDGRPRLSIDPILLSVRSFYLDLHTWSVAEPHRWAAWVAPCPIGAGDLVGSARRHRRVKERSAGRTRTRQPLLPLLVEHVHQRLTHLRQLLHHGRGTTPGEQLDLDGRTYLRLWTSYDEQHLAANGTALVRLREHATGEVINAGLAEDAAFWDWAIIEVLRLTGIRIEELLELTQLSIRRYNRPNGETIALLVIAPSKSDRETGPAHLG
jgi:hypothetical protein